MAVIKIKTINRLVIIGGETNMEPVALRSSQD